MAFIVLFSFILLAWTLPVGKGASPSANNCIVQMSSKYSSESQYCSLVLDSAQNMAKVNVCNEIVQLFEEICTFEFNRSVKLSRLPKPQNVSKENCVLLCADLDLQYILRIVDSNSSTCTCRTLCTVDPEAVAVVSTLYQLKYLIAGSDKGDDEEFGKEDKPGKSKKMGGDDDDRLSKTGEKDETPCSYHFLIYFLAFIVLCVAAFIIFHNKHKIIAFIIQGKQGRRGGRPSTKQYTPLKSKVEDVMPFIEKSTTQSNYRY